MNRKGKGICIECGGMWGQHFNGCPETPEPVEQIFSDLCDGITDDERDSIFDDAVDATEGGK
jgi:hypothetical protein